MSKQETEVAIVGGGAAGIAAARHLHDAGIDCLLVEARDRLGGRGWTVPDADGHAFDLGCGWLHSADRNPWSDIAAANGFTIDRSAPPWTRPSLPVAFTPDEQREFNTAMDAIYDRMSARPETAPDVPVSAVLEPGNRWNGLIGAVGSFISGGDIDRVSARDFINYADTEVNWRVREGYGALIASHARNLPIALNCAVTRIDRSGQRLRLETMQGTIEAARIIVTLPTAILAKRHDLFFPSLPDKVAAAAALPLGLADKLFIALEQPEEFPPGSRVFGRTDTAATASYHFRPFGRPMIECYFGGSLAHELERGGPDAFFAFAREQLTALFGARFGTRLALHHMHCWASDPYAGGSYSFALPGMADQRLQLAEPVDDRIFFAGEACSAHDFSTAHGAYFTGIAAASQVLALQRRA